MHMWPSNQLLCDPVSNNKSVCGFFERFCVSLALAGLWGSWQSFGAHLSIVTNAQNKIICACAFEANLWTLWA